MKPILNTEKDKLIQTEKQNIYNECIPFYEEILFKI